MWEIKVTSEIVINFATWRIILLLQYGFREIKSVSSLKSSSWAGKADQTAASNHELCSPFPFPLCSPCTSPVDSGYHTYLRLHSLLQLDAVEKHGWAPSLWSSLGPLILGLQEEMWHWERLHILPNWQLARGNEILRSWMWRCKYDLYTYRWVSMTMHIAYDLPMFSIELNAETAAGWLHVRALEKQQHHIKEALPEKTPFLFQISEIRGGAI